MNSLIIDVGSSSVRALLFTSESVLRSEPIARRNYHFNADATTDAYGLRQLVENCVDDILLQSPVTRIDAVGMTTFVGNLVGVDEHYHPQTPLYTYADNRSRDSANSLAQKSDMSAIHARTGCRIHPAYHPAKLHWLKNTQPTLFSSVVRWLDFATYCYITWFGRDIPCSYSIASWSGLLNRETLTWDTTWLYELGIQEHQLPSLSDYNNTQSGLSAPYMNRWHALQNTPFYLAIGDGVAANIGSGGISPDRPVLTIGTTAAMRIITNNMSSPATGLWAYRADKSHQLLGGATNEGGNIFAWAKQTLNLNMPDINEALLTHEPTSHKLIALPLLAGERSPHYNESATGTVHGLTLHTTPLDMLYALLEGVALRLRSIFMMLDSPSDFILAGGGALHHSPALAQIFADVLNYPLHLIAEQEVTAYGVSMLISHSSLADISPIISTSHSHIITPRRRYAQHYTDLYHQQEALYQTLYHKG